MPLLSIVPVKSPGMTGTPRSNPIPNSAGALDSAATLGWYIPALLGAPPSLMAVYMRSSTGCGYDSANISGWHIPAWRYYVLYTRYQPKTPPQKNDDECDNIERLRKESACAAAPSVAGQTHTLPRRPGLLRVDGAEIIA